jgi:Receptor family ligand binding region
MLSPKSEFPYFSRLVAPTQIQALVSTLRSFGWSRVSIIGTETQYASDQINLFSRLWVGEHNDESGAWTGEIAYQHSIALDTSGGHMDDSVIEDSVHQALNGVPTDDPTINSRVILLIAHDNHAFEILRISNDVKFQQDSIWVGLPGWGGRMPEDTSFIPPLSGYIGKMVLFRESNETRWHIMTTCGLTPDRLIFQVFPNTETETHIIKTFWIDSMLALDIYHMMTCQTTQPNTW